MPAILIIFMNFSTKNTGFDTVFLDLVLFNYPLEFIEDFSDVISFFVLGPNKNGSYI
jgi:hypothetical protein